MTNLKLAAITGLVVAGAATPLVWQQHTKVSTYRQENEALRQQLQQVVVQEQIAQQVEQRSITAGDETLTPAELQQLRGDRLELMRARDQLRALREQVARTAPIAPAPGASITPSEDPHFPGSEALTNSTADIINYPPAIQQLLLTNYTRVLSNLANAGTEMERYLFLPEAAKLAFVFGYTNEARAYANEALGLDARFLKEPWRGGQALHDANLALGRLALQEGDIEAAKQYLIAAGQAPSSPSLGSFGPNMNLAKDLLKAGERQAVEQYFELCSKFWPGGTTRLGEWTEAARTGAIPNFGANLLY